MIQIMLKPFIDRHNVTTYRLVQETKGLVAERTVYGLARGEMTDARLTTVAALITALRTLTGKPVTVADLLEYQEPTDGLTSGPGPSGAVLGSRSGPDGPQATATPPTPPVPLTAAGVPYTGDAETDAVLNDHPDVLERVAELAADRVAGIDNSLAWEQVKAALAAQRTQ
jgi:hypothetical protein